MNNNDYILTSDGELYHYGVVGMKWGVRRYRNEDGSLTEAGRHRYAQTTHREDIVNLTKKGSFNNVIPKGSNISTKHRERVMAKYENKKTDEMRKADADRNKAYDDYNKYVENYRQSNRDTQTKYEHDYDHTKKGRKLINAIISSDEVRAKVYAGAEWYEKYSKELLRASDKDYVGYYRSMNTKNR